MWMWFSVVILLWSQKFLVTGAGVNYSSEALLDLVQWETLPGTERIIDNLTYQFFAGYIELKPGHFYYYWFFESQRDPANDPVVLWLNGGPGCAGASQALEDNGPLRLDKNLVMYQNPYSWNLIANVIYLDQPTGTGFSYSNNTADYQITDTIAAQNVYSFLQGWFKRFSSFQSNDFKIATQSYGGHYGPFISYEIVTRQTNMSAGDIKINFKGTAVGNPVADWYQSYISRITKMWAEQVIPEPWYNTYMAQCSSRSLRVQNNQWCTNYESLLMGKLGYDSFAWGYPYSMSFPTCDPVIDAANTYDNRLILYQLQESYGLPPQVLMMPCSHTAEYLNNVTIMSLVHARFGGTSKVWFQCNGGTNGMQFSSNDVLAPIQSLYTTLLVDYNVPILVFSGTDDGQIPTQSTQNWVYDLNLTVANPWQTWTTNAAGFSFSGFLVQFNYNLTFITIRNAGHIVSNFQPQASLMMMRKFLDGTWFDALFVPNVTSTNVTYPSTISPIPPTAFPTPVSSHNPINNASLTNSSSTNEVRYTAGAIAAVFFGGLFAGLVLTCLYCDCTARKGGSSIWTPMDKRY
jgi:carboxypeptidase C (cathepsin A)